MIKKFFIVGWLVMAVALVPSRSLAAGITTHIIMSHEAVEHVTDLQLKALLKAHFDTVISASVFPDSGTALRGSLKYVNKPNYGELTHWPPFMEAYYDYVKNVCPAPFSDCQVLVAHFLGTLAHNIEDGIYDEIWMAHEQRMDAEGRNAQLDFAGDMIVIVKYGLWTMVPDYELPVDHVVQVFKSMGLGYNSKHVKTGVRILRTGMISERIAAPFTFDNYADRLPWAINNIYTGPGGIYFTGQAVARYWEALWQRLNGKEAKLVVATYPLEGAGDAVRDTEINVVFARGKLSRSVNASTFVVKDGHDNAVEGRVRNYGADTTHVSTFVPTGPLRPGAKYTATLSTGIQDLANVPPACRKIGKYGECILPEKDYLQGRNIPLNYSWSFTTVMGSGRSGILGVRP